MTATTVRIGKNGRNAGWWILRDALASDLPFTNASGSFAGEPSTHLPFTGMLPADEVAKLTADAPTYVIRSYATPIAWRTAAGEWYVPDCSYSATTSGHQSKVRTAVSNL